MNKSDFIIFDQFSKTFPSSTITPIHGNCPVCSNGLYKVDKLSNYRVLKDVEKLSSRYQTSTWLYLAAINFNENARHTQARTASGYSFNLMDFGFHEVVPNPQPYQEELSKVPVSETLVSQYVHLLPDESVTASVSLVLACSNSEFCAVCCTTKIEMTS